MIKIQVHRTFTGEKNLEEILIPLINYHIEKIADPEYHYDKANTIPSDIQIEGVEK